MAHEQVTVAQFETMLETRKEELTYTDTGKGLAISNNVRHLPIQQVMTILRDEYGADAQLTPSMITGINWLRNCYRHPDPRITLSIIARRRASTYSLASRSRSTVTDIDSHRMVAAARGPTRESAATAGTDRATYFQTTHDL